MYDSPSIYQSSLCILISPPAFDMYWYKVPMILAAWEKVKLLRKSQLSPAKNDFCSAIFASSLPTYNQLILVTEYNRLILVTESEYKT